MEENPCRTCQLVVTPSEGKQSSNGRVRENIQNEETFCQRWRGWTLDGGGKALPVLAPSPFIPCQASGRWRHIDHLGVVSVDLYDFLSLFKFCLPIHERVFLSRFKVYR